MKLLVTCYLTIVLFCPSENQRIEIRTAVGAEPIAVKDVPNLLSCNEWRSFWITWGSRQLIIGRGEEYGKEELIAYLNSDTLSDITSIKFDTFNNSTGKWDFKLKKLSHGKTFQKNYPQGNKLIRIISNLFCIIVLYYLNDTNLKLSHLI